MKKIFSIFGALLAGAMMFSCADQYEESTTPLGTTISVTPDALEAEVEGTGATEEFNVVCDGQWIAVASDWMTVEPSVGSGDATVTVTFAANMDPLAPEELAAPRSGKITFMANKENYVEIEIKQEGDPLKLIQELPFEESFAESQGLFTIEDESLAEGLTYVWALDSDYGMKASAYAGGAKAAVSYLVSPILNLSIDAELTFDHAGNYFGNKEQQISLWIREVGGEWSQLTIPTYCDSWTFVSSGKIKLTEYKGKKVQIGWRYESSSDSACTWEIKNVKVAEATADEGGEEPEQPEDPEDPETPAATTVANLDAIEGYGLYNIETATVVAVEYSNMVVKGTEKMFNVKKLANASANYNVGDVISLTNATVKDAYGVTVIDGEAKDLVIEKTGTVTVEHGEATAIDAAWVTSFTESLVPEYVTVSGVGAASGSAYSLNIAVEGSDINMSVTLPTKDEVTALVGKNVTATGYAFDYNSKNKYVSIMMVNLSME